MANIFAQTEADQLPSYLQPKTYAPKPSMGMTAGIASPAPKPNIFQQIEERPNEFGATEAALSGSLQGIPIVGPSVESGADWLGSLLHSLFTGDTMEQSQGLGKIMQENTNLAHPIARKGGELGGSVAGYAAAAAAAPEVFLGSSIPGAAIRGAGTLAADKAARQFQEGTDIPVSAPNKVRPDAARLTHRSGVSAINPQDVLDSAATGFGLGAVARPLGQIAGAAVRPVVRGVMNWFAPSVPGMEGPGVNTLADALANDTKFMDVRGRMQELGPSATLPDASPSARGFAQGLAPTHPAIPKFYDLRNQQEFDRILNETDSALGTAQSSPLKEQALMKADRDLEGTALPQIFAQAPSVDAHKVLANIDLMMPAARGDQEVALKYIRSQLMNRSAGGQPQTLASDAQTLHNAKVAIGKMMKEGAPGLGLQPGAVSQADGAVNKVYGLLRQTLGDQVPGYGAVMDKQASLARQIGQLKAGTEILRKGAVNPVDLASEIASLPPEEALAKRTGARYAIDQALRTNQNDRMALKGIVGDPGDYNRQNLSLVFQKGPVEDLARNADRANTFYDTTHRVVNNSETARNLAAQKLINPELDRPGGAHPAMLATALEGPEAGATVAAMRGIQKVGRGMKEAEIKARNADIAEAILKNDPMMLQSLIERGLYRTGKAGPANTATALSRALVMGGEGVNRQGQDMPSRQELLNSALVAWPYVKSLFVHAH